MARYDKAEELLRDAKDLEDYYYNYMEENDLFSDNINIIKAFYDKTTPEEFMKKAFEFLDKYKQIKE